MAVEKSRRREGTSLDFQAGSPLFLEMHARRPLPLSIAELAHFILRRRKRAPSVSPRDWKRRLENAAAGADADAAEVVVHPISVRAAGAVVMVWVGEATLVVLVTETEDPSRRCVRR